MKKLIRILSVMLSVALATTLVAGAYGGCVSPLRSTLPALLAMTFPFCAIAAIACAIVCFFFSRLSSAILACALIASFPTLKNYFPLNFGSKDNNPDDAATSFKLMTYNVCNLTDFTAPDNPSPINPTLSFILSQEPDIAALQECATFTTSTSASVSTAQLDSLYARYPYRSNGAEGQAILSKFPFREIRLHYRPAQGFQVRAYSVYAPTDTFTLFNMHLKSIGLNHEDKELYRDITKGKTEGTPLRSELKEIRHSLIGKLSEAFRQRAVQAEKVKELVDSIGGKVIVCGDFNDVPLCYAIRTIESAGLKDAYTQAALGYAVTFHADRFYFRIDHILYRGFTPSNVKRITTPHSDHYPLTAVFTPDR